MLLDIFGFEIFEENGFEQLCINYCNEILQNYFNFVIFTSEKQLYAAEEVICETIEFKDNSAVIKEIETLFSSFFFCLIYIFLARLYDKFFFYCKLILTTAY